MCLLVIIGVTDQGKKELVGLEDGYRESEASWLGLLRDLKERGLRIAPQLAIGDGCSRTQDLTVAPASVHTPDSYQEAYPLICSLAYLHTCRRNRSYGLIKNSLTTYFFRKGPHEKDSGYCSWMHGGLLAERLRIRNMG